MATDLDAGTLETGAIKLHPLREAKQKPGKAKYTTNGIATTSAPTTRIRRLRMREDRWF